MKEVERDNKWNEETDARLEGQVQDLEEYADRAEAAPVGPTESELVIIALLSRLYDINMAMLATMNENRADEVYEAHERGEHFNPPIFVPEVK